MGGDEVGMGFIDEEQAGRRMVEQLGSFAADDVVVLGMARNGNGMAAEVARALGKPLDHIGISRLEVPYHPDLELGVVADDGVTVIDRVVAKDAHVTNGVLDETLRRARIELQAAADGGQEPGTPVSLDGRTVLVIEDRMSSWFPAFAACQVARSRGAAKVVVATPVAPTGMAERFHGHADDVVIMEDLGAEPAAKRPDEVTIQSPTNKAGLVVALPGLFSAPPDTRAVVVIARGARTDGNTGRDRFIADSLNRNGFATLMFDLLVDNDPHLNGAQFEIDRFSARVSSAVDWARTELGDSMPVGVYGSSTGAAIALWAAADPDSKIRAVVSRGGLLGMVSHRLDRVVAPTLLLVGSEDHRVFEGNHEAAERLMCPHALCVINKTADLYAEPTAVDAVARQSISWFRQWLAPDAPIPRIPVIPGGREGGQKSKR